MNQTKEMSQSDHCHDCASLPTLFSFPFPALFCCFKHARALLNENTFFLAILKPGGDSFKLRELKTLPAEIYAQVETEALLGKERRQSLEIAPDTEVHHLPPAQELPPFGPRGPRPARSLCRFQSWGSFHSLRQVSSLENLEAAKSEFQGKFRERRANSGRV